MTTSNHTEQPPIPSARALLMLFLKSFAVMVPWPLLGIVLCYRMFDRPDEAVLLFGGITGIWAAALMAVADLPSDAAFPVIILLAWCLALVVPPVVIHRRRPSQTAVLVWLLIQGGFSIAQAALGALMILGKGC